MRRWLVLVTILILALSATAIAFAQDATPTPPQGTVVPMPPAATPTVDGDDEDTETQPPAAETPTGESAPNQPEAPQSNPSQTVITTAPSQAFLTLDLAAGFALDPFFVSVNGGGTRDATELAPGCDGWTSENPVVSLNWSGEADFVEVFLYSDHNPILIVETPAGDFLCNEDTNRLLQDPTLQIDSPPAGTYNIWVGNADNVGLIPAVLVLTTREDVNIGTFDLTGFVQRPAIRETLADAGNVLADAADAQAQLSATLARGFAPTVLEAGDTITHTAVITGGVPGFVFPTAEGSPNVVCSGVINPALKQMFTVGEGVDAVNIFLETELDGTLLIVQPDGLALCVDDSADGSNLNPRILLEDLQPGSYGVVIGSVQSGEAADGIVTISTDMDLAPALLSPEDLGASE